MWDKLYRRFLFLSALHYYSQGDFLKRSLHFYQKLPCILRGVEGVDLQKVVHNCEVERKFNMKKNLKMFVFIYFQLPDSIPVKAIFCFKYIGICFGSIILLNNLSSFCIPAEGTTEVFLVPLITSLPTQAVSLSRRLLFF